jgi:hypothetical protein
MKVGEENPSRTKEYKAQYITENKYWRESLLTLVANLTIKVKQITLAKISTS